MSRGPHKFKQRDIARAIKAVRSTGAQVRSVEIDLDGKIAVQIGDAVVEHSGRSEWDDLLVGDQHGVH